MIRYALRCTDGHGFESWFQSAGAYETLSSKGMVVCPECGTGDVGKALMAPRVASGALPAPDAVAERAPAPAVPATVPSVLPPIAALARLRRRLEETTDWVGRRFASEARAIHAGDAPDRPIWGEATAEEAKDLAEDGLEVTPVPFGPRAKSN